MNCLLYTVLAMTGPLTETLQDMNTPPPLALFIALQTWNALICLSTYDCWRRAADVFPCHSL